MNIQNCITVPKQFSVWFTNHSYNINTNKQDVEHKPWPKKLFVLSKLFITCLQPKTSFSFNGLASCPVKVVSEMVNGESSTPRHECTHKRRPPPVTAQHFYHLPHLCLCTAVWLASVWRVTGQKYSLFFISITPFLTPPSFTSISPALPLFLLFFYLSNFR